LCGRRLDAEIFFLCHPPRVVIDNL
jgi:hypothetical protein